MAILKLYATGPEAGEFPPTIILSEEAQENAYLGRPSEKTQAGRVQPIPGISRATAHLGISREHALVGWDGENFTIQPMPHRLGGDTVIAVGGPANVIHGPTAIEDGAMIYISPVKISIRVEVVEMEEER